MQVAFNAPITGSISQSETVRIEQGAAPQFTGEEQEETGLHDTELFIRRAFDNDPQKGCELLFRLYHKPMCNHAVRFVYAKEIAEDLVADVFYTFWNSKAYLSVKQSFRAYLFRSVRNRAYNFLANEFKKTSPLELADQ